MTNPKMKRGVHNRKRRGEGKGVGEGKERSLRKSLDKAKRG